MGGWRSSASTRPDRNTGSFSPSWRLWKAALPVAAGPACCCSPPSCRSPRTTARPALGSCSPPARVPHSRCTTAPPATHRPSAGPRTRSRGVWMTRQPPGRDGPTCTSATTAPGASWCTRVDACCRRSRTIPRVPWSRRPRRRSRRRWAEAAIGTTASAGSTTRASRSRPSGWRRARTRRTGSSSSSPAPPSPRSARAVTCRSCSASAASTI